MGKTDFQKSYDAKCKELGLKKMPYRENPKHFSSIGDSMPEIDDKKLPAPKKCAIAGPITGVQKIVYPVEEKILIKKSLLEEVLRKLDNTSDFSDVETIEALREML